MEALNQYRAKIDETDRQLLALYEARMDVCGQVADYKREHNMEIYQPERERQVIARVGERVQNPDHAPGARALFEALMASSRALQRVRLDEGRPRPAPGRPVRLIAYPGAPGAFSEQAALFFAGEQAATRAYKRFCDVAVALKNGEVDRAVLPIENSTAGAVDETYRLIAAHGLAIVGECVIRVEQHLLGLEGATLKDVREIRSHPQAIAQCHDFLLRLEGVAVVPCENTALAAQAVADGGDRSIAAIAGMRAKKAYGLSVLASDIEDAGDNCTRFVCLAHTPPACDDGDKATLLFTVGDQVGALKQVIDAFAEEGINMSHIASSPEPSAPWIYSFFADIEWHRGEAALHAALKNVADRTKSLSLLGLYRRSEGDGTC